jgi:hypothetical protein
MNSPYWSDPNPLYEISIEELGLSEATIKAAGRLGVTRIGDCIDFFARRGDATAPSDIEFLKAMLDHVLPQLEKHGYWPRNDTDNEVR